MFVIRKNQIDAFRVSLRKRKREELLSQLIEGGFDAKSEGRDITIEDKKGNKTKLAYNESFIADKVIKPSGLEYHFTYDEEDRITKFSFPGDEYIAFSYEDDLIQSILLNQNRISLKYDENSRITEVISPDLKSHKVIYKENGQIQSVINRADEIKTFDTSIKSNRLVYSVRDSLNRLTKIETDPLGSEERLFFPDGEQEETVYDDSINAYITRCRGGSTRKTYFGEMYPERVEWEDGSFLEMHINENKQIQTLENNSGVLSYQYGQFGEVVSEGFEGNIIEYRYDEDQLLTEVIYTSGLVVKYIYDEDSRINKITVEDFECEFKYGLNDTIESIVYPNGLIEKKEQGVIGKVTESTIGTRWGSILSKQIYEYDNLDRLVNYKVFDLESSHAQKDWYLTYDDESRLLANREKVFGSTEIFKYDRKGNLVAVGRNNVLIGDMDEVLEFDGKRVDYDRKGNVVSFVNEIGRTIRLNFDDCGLVESIENGTSSTYYWYDALGRRIAKSDGISTSFFYWSGERLIAEKYTLQDSLIFREYLYHPYEETVIGFKEKNNLYWLHSDVRGAVISATDSSGKIVWKATYNSFGEAEVSLEEIHQPWRLLGQYYDTESGCSYSVGRYYSTYLKSYLSLDPFWLYPKATNYSYCYNDPYNKVDTTGRLWHVVGAVTVGAVVGGIMGVIEEGTVEGAIKGAGKGALTGLGAVLGGFGGLAIASAVGAFVSSVYEQSKGKTDVCIPCILKNAGLAATSDAVLTILTAGVSKYASLKILQRMGGKIKVTAWADASVDRNRIVFDSGKWVMLGERNHLNHFLTGTKIGWKTDRLRDIMTPWKWKKVATPFNNSQTKEVLATQVGLPTNVPTVEKIKAFIFQQYMIK